MTSEEVTTSNEEVDLLEINKQQEQKQSEETKKDDVDIDNILSYQDNKEKLDLKRFTGFDMDFFTRVYGSIADYNTRIQMQLAGLETFKMYYNESNDIYFPEWQVTELKYHSVTQGALEKRQSLLAEVEDLQRVSQATNLRIQEMQQEIKERQSRQFRGDTDAINLNRKINPDTTTIEELQRSIKSLEELPDNISREIHEKRTEANWLGFQMYFHIRDRKIFENMRGDHIENIVKACDQKQLGIPKNDQPLKSSVLQGRQGTG